MYAGWSTIVRAVRWCISIFQDYAPFNRREHPIRVAADAFEGMVKELLGQIFVLNNSDIIFIFKTESHGTGGTSP